MAATEAPEISAETLIGLGMSEREAKTIAKKANKMQELSESLQMVRAG